MTHLQPPSPVGPPTTTRRIPTICVGLLVSILLVGTTPQTATAEPYLATVVLTAKSDVSQSQVNYVVSALSDLDENYGSRRSITAVFPDTYSAIVFTTSYSTSSSTSCTRADTTVTCTSTYSLVYNIYGANGYVVTLTAQVTNIPLTRIRVEEVNAGKISGFAKAEAKNPLSDSTVVFAVNGDLPFSSSSSWPYNTVGDSVSGSFEDIEMKGVVYIGLSVEFENIISAAGALALLELAGSDSTFVQSGSTVNAVFKEPSFGFSSVSSRTREVVDMGGRLSSMSVSVGSTVDAVALTDYANLRKIPAVFSAKRNSPSADEDGSVVTNDDDVPVGAIVGGVLGGLVFIGIVVGGVLFWKLNLISLLVKQQPNGNGDDQEAGNLDSHVALMPIANGDDTDL